MPRPKLRGRILQTAGAVVVSLALLTVGGVALVSVRDEPNEGYRLSAETMVVNQGPLDPESLQCPDNRAPSPVDYSDSGILAAELALYEGELIAARIRLAPAGGPLPPEVTFRASWPVEVVGSAGPLCAFLVEDGSASGDLSWDLTDDGDVLFTVEDLASIEPTTIEVWLAAIEPKRGTIFSTSLSTIGSGDQVTIDRLGGRVAVDERSGVSASVTLSTTSDEARQAGFDVTATVLNSTPASRAFDVILSFPAIDGVEWSIPNESEAELCAVGPAIMCELGDLVFGESVEITVEGVLSDAWSPDPAAPCVGLDDDPAGRVCIIAEATSMVGRNSATQSDELILYVPRAVGQPLIMTFEQPLVAGRQGEQATVGILISQSTSDVLQSVEILGSDCLSVERQTGPIDDGDAFLDLGEVWRYECVLEFGGATSFRADATALAPDATRYPATLQGNVIIIAPAMSLVVVTTASGAELEIINTGVGDLTSLAVTMPGCTDYQLIEGATDKLAEQERTALTCTGENLSPSGAQAYATDAAGVTLVARVDASSGEDP